MNATQVIRRGLWALAALFLVGGLVFGQTYKNGGTINNTSTMSVGNFQNYKTSAGKVNNRGTINVSTNYTNSDGALVGITHNQLGGTAGTIDVSGNYANSVGETHNSLAASLIKVGGTLTNGVFNNFVTDTGKVDYKAASAQAVLARVKNNKYGALSLTGGSSAIKTLDSSLTVEGLVTIASTTEFAVGSSNTLTLNAATPFSNSGTFTANASSATVTYNNSTDQSVTGGAYYNLTISNGGTKTVDNGASTVSVAAGGTLTNGTGTFDLGTYALTTTATSSITNNASGTIQTGGTVTFGASHTIAGTFVYYKATGSQDLGAASYTNLTLQGGTGATGKKVMPSGTLNVSGTFSIAGGDRDYSTNTNTFAYTGATSSTNQTIYSSESYYNLSISGASDTTFSTAGRKQADGNLSVTNDFTLAANNVLDMQGNTTITAGGTATNSGKLMWQGNNTYIAGTSGVTEFYGTGAGTVAVGASYGKLAFSGSGTKTVSGAVTANASSGVTALFVYSSGDLSIGAAGNLTINGDVENDGTITNAGTFTVQ